MDYIDVYALNTKKSIISELKQEALDLMARSMDTHEHMDISWDALEHLPSDLYPDMCAAVEHFQISTVEAC